MNINAKNERLEKHQINQFIKKKKKLIGINKISFKKVNELIVN